MGDLVASCSSPLARNRAFGEKLGRGMPLADVLASTDPDGRRRQVVGVGAGAGAAHGVEMPITEVIVGVMHDGLEIGEAVLLLASRSAKPERYGV